MSSAKAGKLKLRESASSLQVNMEKTAAHIRDLIVGMPPQDLLGYIYAQRLMGVISEHIPTAKTNDGIKSNDLINENQFVLEYVHAVLASDLEPSNVAFDEAKCAELYRACSQLRTQAMFYAMASSADTQDGAFGSNTSDIEFHAKATWVMLRGNRYQVLEGEFYHYVLEPHDDILREIYGVGAEEIATGFQAMTDATRSGHADAFTEITNQFEAVQTLAAAQNKSLEDIMEALARDKPEQTKAAGLAMDDMFRGGVANVSRHTNLPSTLLADLAYQRGEETEFFAAGDHVGTPYRTLPARKKPLIQLGSDFYAVDPCFARDAGYRALLYNLLQRKPEYKTSFNERQKVMSEAAFADILSAQLPNAKVFQEVYYRDSTSRQWSENDTLILIDDVLFLVEAKSGAAATIASPAIDFDRHTQSVQDLVVKAHKQCKRFFEYLKSSDEVSLYTRTDGKYVEFTRIRYKDYRVLVPIGLTVESFSPFSTFCKELTEIRPLLEKHAFLSLSIDDLFVLKRLLPTPGEFAHYMEVRQAVAGIRGGHLFDEFDHLGAYLKKNRFDEDLTEQLKAGNASMVVWEGMSSELDRSFENEDWESGPLLSQVYPEEILKLLRALDGRRAPGWLLAESLIRNLGDEGRNGLSALLTETRKSLSENPARYFIFGISPPLFIWMQKQGEQINWLNVNDKASAASLLFPEEIVRGLLVEVTAAGIYKTAYVFGVTMPQPKNEINAHIYDDAERMRSRSRVNVQPPATQTANAPAFRRKIGRNDPCPCQSGLKYKKCHGR